MRQKKQLFFLKNTKLDEGKIKTHGKFKTHGKIKTLRQLLNKLKDIC